MAYIKFIWEYDFDSLDDLFVFRESLADYILAAKEINSETKYSDQIYFCDGYYRLIIDTTFYEREDEETDSE